MFALVAADVVLLTPCRGCRGGGFTVRCVKWRGGGGLKGGVCVGGFALSIEGACGPTAQSSPEPLHGGLRSL